MPGVYDAGDCGREMGNSEGFLVDAQSGTILKTDPQTAIEAEWKSGGRMRAAGD
jgi:hypothetical protein